VFAAFTIILPCFALSSPGPTVTIQLLDGRNGKPMNKARFVILFPDEKGRPGLVLPTNQKGEVQFDAQGSETIIVTTVSAASCDAQVPVFWLSLKWRGDVFRYMKIPPLRGGDFQGMRVYRPMPVSD
jgi:hypothetical protein